MFVPGEDENEDAEKWRPGPEVNRRLFLEWRDARRGEIPGEVMTNPVWRWLIDSNISAHRANVHFEGPSSYDGNAGWCFNRFGRSLTELSDGRKILIGGEHEDNSDPDFFIYNDVVIASPDGQIEILGFPEEHFPPTDFHSATLVGDQLVLIGNLGYTQQRRLNETQVFCYDLTAKRFRQIKTSGEAPGWISNHEAQLDERNGITVHGGKIDHGPENGGYLECFDSWRLGLDDWKWKRLTYQPIQRWKFVREDGQACMLFPKRMARMTEIIGISLGPSETQEFNGELLDRLYDPQVPHEAVVEHDWSERTRYVIDGVSLYFSEEMREILLTVVGELPFFMMDPYVNQVRDRLSELEGANYIVTKQ